MSWDRSAGEAGRVKAGQGVDRPGMAWQEWLSLVRRGMAGKAGLAMALRGLARQGKAGLVRHGRARRGWARRGRKGEAGRARNGMARPGRSRMGSAGKARRGMTRQERHSQGRLYHYRKRGIMKTEVINELVRLHDENDGLRPKEVVSAARPTDSVLHPHFEWRDAVAGELYRESQARYLIRVVRVHSDSDHEPRHVFCHVPASDGEGAYFKTEYVAKTPDMMERALGQFQTKIESLQRSADELLSLVETQSPKKVERVNAIKRSLEDIRESASAMAN